MSFDLDKRALDRWITKESDWGSDKHEETYVDIPDECDNCGWIGCICTTGEPE